MDKHSNQKADVANRIKKKKKHDLTIFCLKETHIILKDAKG